MREDTDSHMFIVQPNFRHLRMRLPPARAARLPTLILLIGLRLSAAWALESCAIDGLAVNPANGNTTAGRTGLMSCRDRDTGQMLREQQIQDGVFMGAVRYFDKGRLAKEQTVNARGNLEGRAREFGPNGVVLRDATYEDGAEVGLVRNFYPDGKLRRVTFYGDSRREGASAEFTPRGQLSALRCGEKAVLAPVADDAVLCGFDNKPSQVELFDDKGVLRQRLSYLVGKRLRSEDLYDNGKPAAQVKVLGAQRIERRFSSEGVKRREVVSLIGDRGAVKQREQEFSERGSLMHDQRWNANGDPLSDETYYLNGQPRSKASYGVGGNPLLIEVTEYYDNGQRAAIGRYLAADRYRQQMPVGTHQRFSDKGLLIAESTYDDKGRVTRERRWDADGKLERDDEVFEDGSRKALARQ